jgi:hypothetical protein
MIVANVQDVIGHVDNLQKGHAKNTFWWRGQSDANWELKPSAYRNYSAECESNFILRFKAKSQVRYQKTPKPRERINWLLLAQHYGLPTRLLDWSDSVLIALYFAVEDENYSDKDGVLYGLLPSSLNKLEYNVESILTPEEKIVCEIAESAFHLGSNKTNKVLAFLPDHFDPRHYSQQTVFTIHDSRDSLLNRNNNTVNFLYKITIKKNAKKLIREQLTNLGIRKSDIFPDLACLAEEIKQLKFRFKNEGKA